MSMIQDLPSSSVDTNWEELAVAAIKSDYDVTIFALLPAVDPRRQFLRTNGIKMGLTAEEVETYYDLFIKAKYWVLEGSFIKTNFDAMNVGELSVQNYLEATLAIISRLSVDGPCEYETVSVATTRELAKEFVQNVHKCFRQFYEKSAESKKSVIFSWSHAGLIAHENKSRLREKSWNEEEL